MRPLRSLAQFSSIKPLPKLCSTQQQTYARPRLQVHCVGLKNDQSKFRSARTRIELAQSLCLSSADGKPGRQRGRQRFSLTARCSVRASSSPSPPLFLVGRYTQAYPPQVKQLNVARVCKAFYDFFLVS
ncbi:hypothetical protein ElyMa_002344300 [Elysia marginata]|uniref:Uncharacterized protein n=1 Tax=Elysia marginata TaxID=1093978 RepID=A0AAV4G9D4_9GAST|nr:hypothetical protein ElyMa_002344300 [Elysia marginata]